MVYNTMLLIAVFSIILGLASMAMSAMGFVEHGRLKKEASPTAVVLKVTKELMQLSIAQMVLGTLMLLCGFAYIGVTVR
jgi:hypothetical protein